MLLISFVFSHVAGERDMTRLIVVRPAQTVFFEKLFFGVTTLFHDILPLTWIEVLIDFFYFFHFLFLIRSDMSV
jgi:hypothetical protein